MPKSDHAACAANPGFASRMRRALEQTPKKFAFCHKLEVGKTARLRVRLHPQKEGDASLHGCKAFQRVGDLQVYYKRADGK